MDRNNLDQRPSANPARIRIEWSVGPEDDQDTVIIDGRLAPAGIVIDSAVFGGTTGPVFARLPDDMVGTFITYEELNRLHTTVGLGQHMAFNGPFVSYPRLAA